MTRAEAARFAGMKRQALRDAVIRSNAEGLAGLKGWAEGPPTAESERSPRSGVRRRHLPRSRPQTDGVSAWTHPILCRWLDVHFAKTYHPSSLKRVLRRMGLSRQKV